MLKYTCHLNMRKLRYLELYIIINMLLQQFVSDTILTWETYVLR